MPAYAKETLPVFSVPEKVGFADMQLYIEAEAKEEIQKKVTSLTQSPSHYREVFDRVNLYMPFIEKVLKEENVPDDFKYLVIQESVLLSDHVSTSDAVGFWQFKQEAGEEVKLRIDHSIDERMHIIASTRGFCRFIKSHYNHFNNWLYALLAHHLGRTGAKNFIAEKNWHISSHKAPIDKKTHWYIYHFIAHKIVFENAIGKEQHPALRLYEYHDCQGKTIHEVSQYFKVPLTTMQSFNRWVKPTQIPNDVRYPMLIPVTHQQYAELHGNLSTLAARYQINYEPYWDRGQQFPTITYAQAGTDLSIISSINGLKGAIAQENETLETLAHKGNITLEQLLAYNEIDQDHIPLKDQLYYFEPKNSKARIHYHIVRTNETWWTIAQKYGIKQHALLLRNRLRQPEILVPGRVLWLRFIRPASIPIAYVQRSTPLPTVPLLEEPRPKIRSTATLAPIPTEETTSLAIHREDNISKTPSA
jgi:membrane-bound lytic murein transglycosylase D